MIVCGHQNFDAELRINIAFSSFVQETLPKMILKKRIYNFTFAYDP